MNSTPYIHAVGTANPPHRYSQKEIYDISTRFYPMYRSPRIEQIFMGSDIDYRHLCIDRDTFVPTETADELHARFADHSVRLGREAILACLERAGAGVDSVDYFVAVSCTGYLCPGLSALLIKDLAMRTNVQRADLVGMGCAGAMPGLQRAHDFVKANPGKRALVLTVEICSACYYVDDDLETVVGNAICGDGAAAVLVGEGPAESAPAILDFETLLDPSFIHTVGFQFRNGKLRIVLSKDIRNVAGGLAQKVIQSLLDRHGLRSGDIGHWVVHSGGRKVIDSIKEATDLPEERLVHSRNVLRNYGNMSSPTVLFVLQETIAHERPARGEYGLMLAMGPGLAIEGALLQW